MSASIGSGALTPSSAGRPARPDILDLIGPEFDRPRAEPASKTLIICAAPRTGSYELARMLVAAGIGVPHEYFHPKYAGILASRWGLPSAVLSSAYIERYIAELQRRRCAGDVFGTKLQYWQLQRSLWNEHGRALLAHAVVVHLFRSDAFHQFVSLHRAQETGRYDFSERNTQPPADHGKLFDPRYLCASAEALAMEDAGFRRVFINLGIRPLFIEFERFVHDPASSIDNIADALGVAVNRADLERAIAVAEPYRAGAKTDDGREKLLVDAMRVWDSADDRRHMFRT
jgi:LPS sulfotransferase NodH